MTQCPKCGSRNVTPIRPNGNTNCYPCGTLFHVTVLPVLHKSALGDKANIPAEDTKTPI